MQAGLRVSSPLLLVRSEGESRMSPVSGSAPQRCRIAIPPNRAAQAPAMSYHFREREQTRRRQEPAGPFGSPTGPI
jgi:hypothetical protein